MPKLKNFGPFKIFYAQPRAIRKLAKLMWRIAAILIVVWAVWTYVGDLYIQHDNNMYPHIKDGDLVITYKLGDYIKGETALYEVDGVRQIGRVVAGPGDVVTMDENGSYMINGLLPYEAVFYDTVSAEYGIEYPYTVPEGEYFILNDMREMFADSRAFGAVPVENMYGRIVFVMRNRGV